ncbi:MAG: response regulator [Gammaproteobacteria bacterium]|nr:response regulator [Gammaproteobacteria bacterium]
MKKRVLIVDDMQMNRELTARLLKIHGYETLSAKDGHQAIQMSIDELPDIILMDIGLPVMDGWEATRIIKQTEATRNIPIIALSANVLEEYIQMAGEAGCDAYESKPINIESLIKTIDTFLDTE